MAKNKQAGDDRRVGAVKSRSQGKNPLTGTWTKRDAESGRFVDVKADPKPFKGVRKEKAPAANSMGIAIVDPAVKPRDVSVAKIRSAVSAITRK